MSTVQGNYSSENKYILQASNTLPACCSVIIETGGVEGDHYVGLPWIN